jgi:6-phosphogluconate dehydrogenase
MNISCPHWIKNEFKSINFGDLRLVKRFKTIIKQLMVNAQKNISSAFHDWSSIKGCYRFLENEKTDANLILNEHIKRTVERINS